MPDDNYTVSELVRALDRVAASLDRLDHKMDTLNSLALPQRVSQLESTQTYLVRAIAGVTFGVLTAVLVAVTVGGLPG